jgi:hypothetical protein
MVTVAVDADARRPMTLIRYGVIHIGERLSLVKGRRGSRRFAVILANDGVEHRAGD